MDYDQEPMDFLTIHRRDYTQKPITKIIKYIPKQELPDPIADPYKRFLALEELEKGDEPPMERLDDFYERFKVEHPKICQLHFPTPVDKHVIHINTIDTERSIYQYYYCDLDRAKVYADRESEKKNFRLPEDWEIPETTYLASYRERTKKMFHSHPVFQVSNITRNENELKIYETGLSEYQRTYGKTGEEIINCEMFGKPVHPACSKC